MGPPELQTVPQTALAPSKYATPMQGASCTGPHATGRAESIVAG
jgi:hypothetical protein